MISDLISVEVMDQNLRGGLVEQVWCRITVRSDRILVGCKYRPEKNEISDEALLTSLKTANELVLSGTFDSLLIAGDFNMGSIRWTEGSGFVSCYSYFERRFVETLDDCYFTMVYE